MISYLYVNSQSLTFLFEKNGDIKITKCIKNSNKVIIYKKTNYNILVCFQILTNMSNHSRDLYEVAYRAWLHSACIRCACL